MKQVIIHLKESYLNSIKELGYDYTLNDNEVNVILPDVEYDFTHPIVDPDAQLCANYGIDYDYVNMMQSAWSNRHLAGASPAQVIDTLCITVNTTI